MMCDIPVYVISLTSKWLERGKPTLKWWSQQCSNVNRFVAIEPKDFNLEDVASLRTISIINKTMGRVQHSDISEPEQVACYLSHVELWKKAIELDEPIIIVEDDVRPAHLDQRLLNLPTFGPIYNNAIVLIQNNPHGFKAQKTETQLLKVEYFIGLGAYFITPQAAQTLLNVAFPVDMHVDRLVPLAAQTFSNFDVFAVPDSNNQSVGIDSTLFHTSVFYIETERRLVWNWILGILCIGLFIGIVVLWLKYKSIL